MPTTANFSLEYPDDNSSVDIAGHFETLADDVDTAINTRLALTGGTLTGSLSGTSLSLSSTLLVTGTTTLAGDLTISKASPGFKVSSSSGNANAFLERPAGSWGQIYFRTGTSTRWVQWIGSGSESGSNAGSDFGITRYDDAGSILGTALTIIRSTGDIVLASTTDSSSSTTGAFKTAGGMGIAKALYVGTTLNVTGATTLTGDLTVSKAAPYLTVNSTSGHAYSLMSRPAGSRAWQYFQTAGSTRWTTGVSADAESGANAGSNYTIAAWDDAGSALSTPLTITRSTGAVTLTGDLSISKASATHTISSSSGTTNVNLDSVAGTYKYLNFRTGTSARWTLGTTATAESGSNAGTDLFIGRSSDGGAYIDAPLIITRSTGAMTLTGDVTVSKASAIVSIAATSGHQALRLKAEAGFGTEIYFTNNANQSRWVIAKSTTAESGANAGSDFQLWRYDDAGNSLGQPLTITRSTGKVNLGSVGATAGLELGASGPRMMSGTGSPEGVVTAPVGSEWIRTDGATLGDFKYQKRSGTGNTGWVVSEGDTGSRDISSVLTADADRTLASTILLRRTGNRVVLSGVWRETTTSPNNRAFYSLPVGFRPAHTLYQYVPYDAANTTAYRNIRVPASGNITYGGPTSGSNYEYHVQWTTPDAWPSSLPGSAA